MTQTQTQTIAIYSRIFDIQYTNDPEFYKSIYISPAQEDALRSVLVANLEGSSSYNVTVTRELLFYGIGLLSDALECPQSTSSQGLGISNSNSLDSAPSLVSRSNSAIPELDDGGDDITSLNGRKPSITTVPFVEIDEGDDITTLNGKVPDFHDTTKKNSRRNSSTSLSLKRENSSGQSKDQSVRRDSASSLGQLSLNDRAEPPIPSIVGGSPSQFQDIDPELRVELASNILSIIKVWFQALYEANINLNQKRSRLSARSNSLTDVVSKIFQLPGSSKQFNDTTLSTLLSVLKWYFEKTMLEIELSSDSAFPNLIIIKDIIYLLADIVRSFYLSLAYQKESANEFIILKSLVFSLFQVDFSETFNRLLRISNGFTENEDKLEESSPSESGPDSETPTLSSKVKFLPPKITLSPETLIKMYTIVGSLASLPSNLLPLNSTNLSSDITNLLQDSPNVYEYLLVQKSKFNAINFHQEVGSRLIPILAVDYNYCYNFREDLLVGQIQNSSFMNWLTNNRFSDNLYVAYNTAELVTNFEQNFRILSLTEQEDDPYLKSIQQLHEHRLKIAAQKEIEDFLELPELLPISLMLLTYSKNHSFVDVFTRQQNKIDHKIEDMNHLEDRSIELLEIWLCILSYVFQYQYKSEITQLVTKLSLSILLKLTSPNSMIKANNQELPTDARVLSRIKAFQINEFKWKLSHQKSPIIPTDAGKFGIKSSLFYILDIVQNLVRFNLTNKLNIENFKMAINVAYQIVSELKNDPSIELGRYSWVEFHTTIFNLIKFVKRQQLGKSKYFQSLKQIDSLKSLIEETFLLIELLLASRFNETIQFQEGITRTGNENPGSEVFRSINYDLIYNLLLNYEIVNELLDEFDLVDVKHLSNVGHCLEHFEGIFHLTEESKAETDSKKLDMLDFDFDSPILVAKINEFTFGKPRSEDEGIETEEEVVVETYDDQELQEETKEGQQLGYKYTETLSYINKSFEVDHVKDTDMIRIFNVMFKNEFHV